MKYRYLINPPDEKNLLCIIKKENERRFLYTYEMYSNFRIQIIHLESKEDIKSEAWILITDFPAEEFAIKHNLKILREITDSKRYDLSYVPTEI